ncbi:MAG: hypothetical protein IKJ67_07385 [Bacteroidales bacterium]|nr:hypothetical protein [Bacteroidales bacterium]
MNTKKIFKVFAVIMIILSFNSCYKEGDFDPITNSDRLELDPVIGMPLVNSIINVDQLLGMFDESEANITFDENGLIYIGYEDSAATQLEFFSQSKYSIGTAKYYDTIRKEITGEFSIDLFENMVEGDNNSFNLEDVLLSLECESKTETNIPILFKNIGLYMVFSNGQEEIVAELDDVIELRDLHNNRRKLLEDLNVAQFISRCPVKFRYELDVELDLNQLTIEELANIPEIIELDFFYSMNMQLRGTTSKIDYLDTLDFNLNIDLDDVKIGDSKFLLELNNGFPLKFDIKMDFVDSNYNYISSLFPTENGVYIINASNIDADGNAVSYAYDLLEIPFSAEKIEDINKAKYILLSTSFITAQNGTKVVSIQKDNHLKLRLGAVINPILSTDL